jgi:TolB-like protein
MKNLFLVLAVLFLTPFFLTAQASISLDESIQNCVRYLQSRSPRGTRAALLFIQSDNPELGEFVLNKLSSALVNANWFTVLERNTSALERINQEMDHHLSGNVSQQTELSIGRQLGAQVLISGSFIRAGQNWRLDIQVINVETAARIGHFIQENIRSDPAWNTLASGRNVSLVFDGDDLAARERQTITAGLRNALTVHNVDLELSDSSSSGYVFNITTYLTRTPSGLIEAEVTITFKRGARIIYENRPFIIRETTETLVARRIVEQLRGDREFFNRVNREIR